MASNGNGNGHRPKMAERVAEVGDKTRSSQAWNVDLPARLDLPQGLHRQPP